MNRRYCLLDRTFADSREFLQGIVLNLSICTWLTIYPLRLRFPLVYNYLTISTIGKEDSTIFAQVWTHNKVHSLLRCLLDSNSPLLNI